MAIIEKKLQDMTILDLLRAWWVQLKEMFVLDEKNNLISVDNYEELKHKLDAIDQELRLKLQENAKMPYIRGPELEG